MAKRLRITADLRAYLWRTFYSSPMIEEYNVLREKKEVSMRNSDPVYKKLRAEHKKLHDRNYELCQRMRELEKRMAKFHQDFSQRYPDPRDIFNRGLINMELASDGQVTLDQLLNTLTIPLQQAVEYLRKEK